MAFDEALADRIRDVLGSRESIRLVVMLVLLALNVGAELFSYSRVIDSVPPLRWFDRLGSRRPH